MKFRQADIAGRPAGCLIVAEHVGSFGWGVFFGFAIVVVFHFFLACFVVCHRFVC